MAERGTIVIGVGLDASRARDPHRRGGAAEKHIQDGRAGHGAREREEKTAAVIAGVEGTVVERLITILCLDFYKGVVASAYVAQRDGAVFQVSTMYDPQRQRQPCSAHHVKLLKNTLIWKIVVALTIVGGVSLCATSAFGRGASDGLNRQKLGTRWVVCLS
jgi:hypothetical protein